MTDLVVRYGGREVRGDGDSVSSISFGRSTAATIKLDRRADAGLSRLAGEFVWTGSGWRVANTGSQPIVVVLGGAQSIVGPGSAPLLLPAGSSGNVVVTTTTTYKLSFEVGLTGGEPTPAVPESKNSEALTVSPAALHRLTERERRMLAALCEPRLLDPTLVVWSPPTHAEVCERLELTARQGEKILDSIAMKLAGALPGLVGSNKGRASARRQLLAEFAVHAGLVDNSDLRLLEL